MNFYKKYLKYKNKYLKVKKQIGGMKEETFEYNGKIITAPVPTDIICVISFNIMDNPVMLSDGHTYERSFIIQWLTTHNTSPKTGAQLTNRNIILPNHALKAVIEEIKKEIYDKKLNEQVGELEKQAENSNSCAAYKLGLMYMDGIGLVVKNNDRALKYFERADNLGNSDALLVLGYIYNKGELNRDINFDKSREYLERSAQLGNNTALNNLGTIYRRGLGVEKDYDRGKYYYEKAAELGNSYALINLAELYENGLGVAKDYNIARKYYERAAKLDNTFALHELYWYYRLGLGVEQDHAMADIYLQQAKQLSLRIANGYKPNFDSYNFIFTDV